MRWSAVAADSVRSPSRLLATVLLLVGLTAGCAQQQDANGDARLVGPTWALHEVYQGAEQVVLDPLLSTSEVPGAPSWVAFGPEGRFEGEGPCNKFRGSFELDGESLRVHSGTMQAGACPVGEGMPNPEAATAVENLIVTPFISESVFDIGFGDGELLLSVGALRLVYRASNGQ